MYEQTGTAWSSDEYSSYYYKLSLSRADAEKILRYMDVVVKMREDDADFYKLAISCGSCEVFADAECTDEIICDVRYLEVVDDYCCFCMKNKYCAEVYESNVMTKKELEDFLKKSA
jgi:hypothetical protein